MNSPVLFREVQRFRQWWLWFVISIGPLTVWLATYRRYVLGEHYENKPTPDGLHGGALAADRDWTAPVVLQCSV